MQGNEFEVAEKTSLEASVGALTDTYDELTKRQANHTKQVLSQQRRSLAIREEHSKERKKLLFNHIQQEFERQSEELCKDLITEIGVQVEKISKESPTTLPTVENNM